MGNLKKAIVTGADGFIGYNLIIQLLEEGCEVWGVGIDDKKFFSLKNENFHFIKAFFSDYCNISSLLPNDADCFFHFAWNGVYGDSFKDYKKQIENAKYCCDALMIAKKIHCKKFILASTINTLETRGYLMKDDIKPRYTNIYAMSKLAAEMLCKTLAYQNDIEFNCGLISMVYGENNFSRMVPNVVIENLLCNRESNLLPYDTKYDLIYVKDVARLFIAMAKKGIDQKTYYIGHRVLSNFGNIFEEIRDIINPQGILNFGVYQEANKIDYSLIKIDELYLDTGVEPIYSLKDTILKTADFIKTIIKGG